MSYPNLPSRSKVHYILENFKKSKILVIGDAMIDRYHHGTVNRLSQEAPIPVLLVNHEEDRLGGAAAVANNLASFGCDVYLSGLLGNDNTQQYFLSLLQNAGINSQLIVKKSNFKTIIKTRFMAGSHHIVRVDYENDFILSEKSAQNIAEDLVNALEGFQAIVISDYGKGFLHPIILKRVIEQARYLNIPCICDPYKFADFSIYKGVSVIKPNRSETEAFSQYNISDKQGLLAAAKMIKNTVQADFLAISLDKAGIFYYHNEQEYMVLPTEAKDVFDVSGAGDMVTAVISAFLTAGVEPKSCLMIANLAASITISKLGSVSITLDEIKQKLTPFHLRKVIDIKRLIAIRESDNTNKWTFTNGYFDNLSAQQIKFLLKMSEHGDVRVIGLNSDKSILKNKGKEPILKSQDRAELLAALHSVDWIVIFDDDDATSLIEQLRPHFVVKGANFGTQVLPEQEAIKKVNAEMIKIKVDETVSL